LQQVEEVTKTISDTQQNIDDKIDGMFKMMQQRNASSEMGSAEKRCFPSSSSPPNPAAPTLLTPEKMAFLKKQEAAGKILLHQQTYPSSTSFTTETTPSISLSFHIPDPRPSTQPGQVYTHIHPAPHTNNPPSPNQSIHNHYTNSPNHINLHQSHTTMPDANLQPNTSHFNLSIARPKLDFPSFSREEPVNWL
jgi:hypothetical protein